MKIIARVLMIALVWAVMLPQAAAWAIPAFSKKYEAPCTLCHSTFPRLNTVGEKFKVNGFQLPDSEDGSKTAKLSPTGNLFLDSGLANPPISILLDGGFTISQPDEGPDKKQSDKYFCCVDGAAVTVDIGGTVGKNIGYWVSLPWGKGNVDQAYLRFVNFMGPGMLNIDFGAMKVLDYDAVGIGREWFASPLVAFHGNPYVNNALEIGMNAHHNDTGIRFYGRPEFGQFSYEFGLYTGSQIIGDGEDDSKFAYTIMGRADMKNLSFSLRYWGNESGALDQTVLLAGSDDTIMFPADINNTDEKTEEYIISLRYRHPRFEADITVDRTTFKLKDRTATGSDGMEHTLAQDDITRLGVSAGIIWHVNSWFETGMAYGISTIDSFERTVDGVTSSIDSMGAGMFQFRLGVMPVANMKIGLEFQMDTSDDTARTRAGGETYSQQNKVLLHWDLAL